MSSSGIDAQELTHRVDEAGGIYCRDLPPSTELLLQVGGQTVYLNIHDPATGMAAISSRGLEWAIFLHMTTAWGCTLGPDTISSRSHWLARGCRLCVDPFVFPLVERIVYQGLDLTDPDASQMQ